jgi:hypothetical protein
VLRVALHLRDILFGLASCAAIRLATTDAMNPLASTITFTVKTPSPSATRSNTMPCSLNLFLLFAFKWFANLADVDGDGKHAIIDSYKFAGAISNVVNKQIKAQAFPQTHELQEKWQAAKDAHDHGASPTTQANLDAAATLYKKYLEIMYVHQECWILNAIPSQRIER